MNLEKFLINSKFVLQKYPGKGGWTYAAVPKFQTTKSKAFGMLKVKGSIDGFEFKGFHLMPMKSGQLFLPVKAEIRKKIKKEAGDTVTICLIEDHDSFEIPLDFLSCLKDDPQAEQYFFTLSEAEKNNYVRWIYSAKKEETKILRMADCLKRLSRKKKFSDKEL